MNDDVNDMNGAPPAASRSPGARAKICWVITGAGHFLSETAEFLSGFGEADVDIWFTRAAREVAARYGLLEKFGSRGRAASFEGDYSSSGSIRFAGGRYDALVIAPATANTVAKCALGIADSLASNFFAQAGKSGVPIYVLPTDMERDVVSVTPSGKKITVTPRPVDIARAEALANFPGTTVLRGPEEMARALRGW
jgi:flavoprotein